jgi:uncharacterized protein (TIRG00374 family)
MRNFIFAIVLLLGIVFVIGRMAEVQSIVETLRGGDWRFLILALGMEIIWLFSVAATYKVIFRTMGLDGKIKKLVILAAAANFVNIVAPTAGVGGMAVFVSESRQSGHSTGRVTVASVLYILYDYIAFLCILTLGFIVLIRRNNVTVTEITAAVILVVIAIGMAFLLYLGMRSAKKLGDVLAWLARFINKLIYPFIHQRYLQEHRAYEFALEAADGLQEMRKDPRDLFPPALLAVLNKILLVTILFLTFLAFNVPYSLGTVIASFSIGYLFVIVSPTPAGIGIVEGVLALIISSFHIPLGAAAVVALAYRGITFWFPLLLGFIAFRLLDAGERKGTALVDREA